MKAYLKLKTPRGVFKRWLELDFDTIVEDSDEHNARANDSDLLYGLIDLIRIEAIRPDAFLADVVSQFELHPDGAEGSQRQKEHAIALNALLAGANAVLEFWGKCDEERDTYAKQPAASNREG